MKSNLLQVFVADVTRKEAKETFFKSLEKCFFSFKETFVKKLYKCFRLYQKEESHPRPPQLLSPNTNTEYKKYKYNYNQHKYNYNKHKYNDNKHKYNYNKHKYNMAKIANNAHTAKAPGAVSF